MDVESILSKRVTDREGRDWHISQHAQKRAESRFISFGEIRSVLGHGGDSKRPADNGAWEYKFAGVIVIVDSEEKRVLTVYPEPGYGIDLDKVVVTAKMMKSRKRESYFLRLNKQRWTSHTVAVIDQSGSMRAADIDKSVTRSDLVWLTLAVDLVKSNLESGERKPSDFLSVIFMKDDATVVIDRQPFDWILFNNLVDIMNTEKPSTGGNYIPALNQAGELLLYNRSRNCALTLLFLSDGKPSDHLRRGDKVHLYASNKEGWLAYMKSHMGQQIGELASLFGKRLNMCFYAIGPSATSDFSIMKHMADQAKEYECPVVYQPATLKAGALSTALRTMSTTTTNTMSTISDIPKGFEYRDMLKMKKSEVGSPVVTETWEVILQETIGSGQRRIVKSEWGSTGWTTVSPVFSDPNAVGVAWETRWFGEGTERLAKECREVGPDGQTFVGPPMVLKASITVNNSVDVDSKEFHKRFCKSQGKAQSFASKFNEAILKLPFNLPTIEFLPCWVYMVQLASGERKAYLVEPSLNVNQYKKFNDNQGNVYTSRAVPLVRQTRQKPTFGLGTLLEVIEESDEESEESNIESAINKEREQATEEEVDQSDILQAFSCWTYKVASRHRYLVCDLQGTYVDNLLVRGEYRLTDPVIHTIDTAQEEIRKRSQSDTRERFGRTDRGQQGIDDFFSTHKCSRLCRMLGGRRLRSPDESFSAHFDTADRTIS